MMGVIGLTCNLAADWARHEGIRVNAVVPGYFPSELTVGRDPEVREASIARNVPYAREGRHEECAAASLDAIPMTVARATGRAIGAFLVAAVSPASAFATAATLQLLAVRLFGHLRSGGSRRTMRADPRWRTPRRGASSPARANRLDSFQRLGDRS